MRASLATHWAGRPSWAALLSSTGSSSASSRLTLGGCQPGCPAAAAAAASETMRSTQGAKTAACRPAHVSLSSLSTCAEDEHFLAAASA